MKRILSLTRRAVEDYNMISDGDRIAVGVSGGKDSLLSVLALSALRRFYPRKFELYAITIDMGIEGMDFTCVKEFCSGLDVPYIIEKTDIKKIVFDVRQEKNPCALCANLRRGALHNTAKENGISKVVLGHHFDDAVETFMMSLLYEGRVNSFVPVTYLDRMDITLLRPLIYIEEKEIKRFIANNALPVVKSLCPANGNTKRQYIKELLYELNIESSDVRKRIFTAMRNSVDGWK